MVQFQLWFRDGELRPRQSIIPWLWLISLQVLVLLTGLLSLRLAFKFAVAISIIFKQALESQFKGLLALDVGCSLLLLRVVVRRSVCWGDVSVAIDGCHRVRCRGHLTVDSGWVGTRVKLDCWLGNFIQIGVRFEGFGVGGLLDDAFDRLLRVDFLLACTS